MKNSRPQYPIGVLTIPKIVSEIQTQEALEVLRSFPTKLKDLVATLSDEQLDQPYREGSWTLRQLVHHISDSHSHAYNRIRWTLTEDTPLIKAYNQDAYAEMNDYKTAPIAWSLKHIEIIHHKIYSILNSLTKDQWNRSFIHPDTKTEVNLKQLAMQYKWHSTHHYLQLKNAL